MTGSRLFRTGGGDFTAIEVMKSSRRKIRLKKRLDFQANPYRGPLLLTVFTKDDAAKGATEWSRNIFLCIQNCAISLGQFVNLTLNSQEVSLEN